MDEKKQRSISRVLEEIALYESIKEGLELISDEMTPLHMHLVKVILKNLYKTVECVEKDLPIVGSHFTNPSEVLTVMDLHWFFIYQAAWGGGMENPHLMEDMEKVDKLPVPNDCCTLLRMGLYYLDEGLFPKPTAYVGITEPCDGIAAVHEAITNHKAWRDVPSFAPEPIHYDFDEMKSIRYYADEFKRMVGFLETHTGKKLDMDGLKRTVEETNKHYALWQEYNTLRRAVPTPHDPILPQSCFYLTNFPGAGNPENTQYFEDLVANAEKRIKEDRPVLTNQKFRVLWYDIPSVYFTELTSWMEQEHGGVVVLDMVSHCPYTLIDTSSEETIFEGLAKRSLMDQPMIHQARGKVENFLTDISQLVRDFHIDCVIWPGHMGHKDSAASINLMRDKCRELDVAFLSIGLDHVDKRYTTVDEIKDRISKFVNTMGLA